MTDASYPWQLLPDLTHDELAALRADIAENGVLVPVEVDEDGAILDGHNRARIAGELGVPYDKRVVSGLTDDGKRDYALRVNAIRRQLSPERRRPIVARLYVDEGMTQQEIAGVLGIDQSTVSDDLRFMGVHKSTARGRPPKPPETDECDVCDRPWGRCQCEKFDDPLGGPDEDCVCETCGELFASDVWHCPECDHHWGEGQDECKNCLSHTAAPPTRPEPAHNNPALYTSNSPEWYTPSDIIRRVVSVLGTIDLDPCSNSIGEPNVPADTHYTEGDDGLSLEWSGRVYMNPPYGRGIDEWVAKLDAGYQNGRITEAVALLPARVDTRWFRILRDYPVCFVNGRLRFSDADPAPFPSAAFYLGPDKAKFVAEFAPIGDLYRRILPTSEAPA